MCLVGAPDTWQKPNSRIGHTVTTPDKKDLGAEGDGTAQGVTGRICHCDMYRRATSVRAATVVLAAAPGWCAGAATAPQVVLEAHWQCDVQRLSFDDLSALTAELEN